MNLSSFTKSLAIAALASCLTTISLSANAGGFQLFEASGAQLGNAFAGNGAEADDASIEYYNPAGLVRIHHPQMVIAGTGIDLNTDVHVTSSTSDSLINQIASQLPFGFGVPERMFPVSGSRDLHPGGWNFVPALHFAYPIIDNRLVFGFGINAPFGLETSYRDRSSVRYIATFSQLMVADISADLGFYIGKGFSIGAGGDLDYIRTRLDQDVSVGPEIGLGDAQFKNRATDWSTAWHIGIMEQFTPHTRIGVAYRSSVDFDLEGPANIRFFGSLPIRIPIPFVGPITIRIPLEPLSTFGQVRANVRLPGSWDVSFYHDFNQHWAFLASWGYTRWSTIQTVTLRYAAPIADEVIRSVTVPLFFRNTWKIAFGLNYRPNKNWVFRTGTAWDESPVRSATTRTFRLADNNRIWLAFGIGYQILQNMHLDISYAHLFVQNSSIRRVQTNTPNSITIPAPAIIGGPITFSPVLTSMANANVKAGVNEISAQLTWNIA